MKEDTLNRIIESYQSAAEIEGEHPDSAGAEIESTYLFGRLHRAFLGLDGMTPGRTAIFAKTAAQLLHRADFEIQNGRKERAHELIVQVANSMSALHDLEEAMLQEGDKQG